MARKSKANKEGGQRTRRKYVSWELDGAKPGSPSSQEALLSWFAMPGNVERWRRQKHTELLKEIVSLMRSHGIKHREASDVNHKMQTLANGFASAAAHLGLKGQEEAFDRGEADPKTVEEVNKICPHYQQLLPIFGTSPTVKKAQMLAKNTASDKSSGATDVAGGVNSAAGKWKESLEKDRGKAAAGAAGGSKAKPAEKETKGKPSAAEKKGEQQQSVAAEKTVVERAAPNGKQSPARAKKEVAEESETYDARTDAQQVVVEEEGALADVEDAGEEKQTRAEPVPEEAPASDDSDSDSSDEEQADTGAKDKLADQEKKQHQAGETSSSEEEDSDEDREESASEEEVDDAEERIPLAQPDEETEEEVKEEPAERNEGESEESDAQVEESEEEEEVEEEPDNREAKESSDDSDSSSSESESEDAHNETEDPPTLTEADSEQHEEPDNGEHDDDEMEEEEPPTQKAVEQSDSTSAQERTPRKRRSSVEPRAPRAKRARRDTADVTRDLKRAAFVEQAKQEQAQREELFQLERSKLECELAAKQVQLAMEKALARRTLLGAGIDPAEVDRVLQL